MLLQDLLPLIVAVPLLGAALLVAGGRRLPRIAADALGTACAAAAAGLALTVLVRAHGEPAVEWLGGWTPVQGHSVGIVLVADPIGLGLAALVSVLVVAVLTYSWHYFEEEPHGHAGSFPAMVLLFQAGMCGFAITGDLFNAFVFFELMGVVAYALTGYRVEEARAVQGALTFGLVNSLGGYATLLGIGLLYARTGELGMAQIGRALDADGGRGGDALVLCAFVLVMTGLLVKAAAVPFHFWLPDAHAVAPTPVCMLLSGVMVEFGVYGVARVYWTVFAGAGGVAAADVQRALLVLGAVTAVAGAVLCWQQRHLKRMLAFSTIGHTGLFLVGVAVLSPEGIGGTALYVLGHAGVKAALFACTGIVLDRYGDVDEYDLHGRARDIPLIGALYAIGGIALAGLPPFGTALGKGAAEEAAGHLAGWLPALYVLVSAVTGATVLRACGRVFWGLGPHPHTVTGEGGGDAGELETRGEDEEPETSGTLRTIPPTMVAVPLLLLAGALAVGTVPGLAHVVGDGAGHFTDRAAYAASVLGGSGAPPKAPSPPPWWTGTGVLLGLLSAALAAGLATAAVRRPVRFGLMRWTAPLRRLHSGHVGDYVAFTAAGMALLGALLLL